MVCPKCGANNTADAIFCSQCATRLHAEGPTAYSAHAPAPSESGMSGAEALAIAGEKTALWSENTLAGYSMSKHALDDLEAQGQGDSEAAYIAQRGINIAKAKWIIGGIVFVIVAVVMISVMSHMGSQPTYP